ncbi:AI-2E family transporter [Phaeocystidibacter luteus]|uniref:AI-2E family transporter n=1 Tax=Phaeocystidibacter luteus TaxID=911197 RepID=A0A6N6RLP9_9FLAO|nr:AI-2E family transporter [Phaeocystidibacter luteus]KAB2814493.1 AI-2E family transporter [Phaeocystidibacter luteus]
MKNNIDVNERFKSVAEITIRLGFLLLLIAWCLRLLYPFAGVILWGVILAIAAGPLHLNLKKRMGDNSKRASIVIVLVGLFIIVIPSWIFMESLVHGVQQLKASIDAGSLTIPPPTSEVGEWPVVGDKVFGLWSEASENLEGFTSRYIDQIGHFGYTLVEGLASIGGSIISLIISILIAGVLLATPGTRQTSVKFFHKLVGDQGEEFTNIISKTVSSVVKGVIGVAFIQAILVGLGLVIAGVPYAGAWTLVALVLAILQLPVLPVSLLAAFWLYSNMGPVPASLWTVYLLLAGASDNILKPILLGKGASVPMIVIFLGVIGGFLMSGFIGLFTGAIIVSIGYKLFVAWLNGDDDDASTSVQE